jgi:acetylornithine deacetylase/succinyl-diaminopimelate desuccinylase-like protein
MHNVFKNLRTGTLAALLTALMVAPVSALAMSEAETRTLAHEILSEIVTVRSVDGMNTTEGLVRTVAERFLAAGFPPDDVRVLVGPQPGIGNLVVRLRGNPGKKRPILLLAHIDVVDALKSDWTLDPFVLNQVNGEFIGRGVADNKAGAAHLVTTLLKFKEEGFVPDRDLIIILTGDEETNGNGINWLITGQPELQEAEFALNSDAGGGTIKGGVGYSYSLQTSEKMYLTFNLEVKNPGGHSSRPRPDNAIYRLTAAISRVADFKFPATFNETSKSFFRELAKLERGDLGRHIRSLASARPNKRSVKVLSKDPWYNAMIRTTCVATRLEAGHADNALPQTAKATVNCRIMPGVPAAKIETTLNRVVADPKVSISRDSEPVPSDPSPLRTDVLNAVRTAVGARYPGIPILPTMSTGATDGLYVRNAGIPTYGINGLFSDPQGSNAHGMNEHIKVEQFYAGLKHWDIILKALSSSAVTE